MRQNVRRHWLPLNFIVLFAALGAYLLFTSHAATPLEPSVAWTTSGSELKNINSGLCLGLTPITQTASGTKMLLEGCSAQKNQEWTLTWGDGTTKSTTVVNGFGQCLDDTLGSSSVGNPVQVYTCNGEAASQTWSTGYGDGTIRIHGLCLGVNGNAKTAGSAIVLSDCNLPTPTLQITAPGSGATIGGQSVTVSAAASVSSGSIQNITLSMNGLTVATCANATSCSKAWNSTSLGNGTYTLTASTTSSGGVTAQTSEPVVINNPSNSETAGSPPSSGGSPSAGGGTSSGGGGSTPSGSDTSNGSNTFGGVSTDSGSETLGSSDLTGSGTGSTTISAGSDTNTSGANSNSNTNSSVSSLKGKSGKSSVLKTASTIFGILVLLAAAAFIAFFIIRRKQATEELPHVQVQNMPSYPQEDSGTSAARLNWWLPENERQQLASTPQQSTAPQQPPAALPTGIEPPDMFEEGFKRLDEEEQRRQTKGY